MTPSIGRLRYSLARPSLYYSRRFRHTCDRCKQSMNGGSNFIGTLFRIILVPEEFKMEAFSESSAQCFDEDKKQEL